MAYKPRTLYAMINDINRELYLPHIQRPFVWDEDQMRRLFDSLMRNYPIQTFLFWRTKDAIKPRRFMDRIEWDTNLSELYDRAKGEEGIEKVFVLDGQQRLQTLYALFSGTISGATRSGLPREAYIDITSGQTAGEDGLLYRIEFLENPAPLPKIRLRDFLGRYSQKNAEDIADEINDQLNAPRTEKEDPERRMRERRVRSNVGQIVSLLRNEIHFWIEELDGVASDFPYRKVLEIFVRVNSGGTKLDAADLMFAAMKEGWEDIEENVEEVVMMLNNGKLDFDKSVVLKAIFTALGYGATLNPDVFTSSKGDEVLGAIQSNWSKIESAFNRLRDFITNDLQLYADKVVRSYNAFVPIADFFFHNEDITPGDYQLLIAYYYKSQLFNWYGRQTDGVINALHGIVGRERTDGFPLSEVMDYFIGRGNEVMLKKGHLLDSRLRFILLSLLYVQTFQSSPFNVRFKGNEPHIDHIYPKSRLYRTLELSTEEVNHLGNYRYVGANENLRKRAELPAPYFARLKAEGVPIEKHLLVPEFATDTDRLKMDISDYRWFRDARLDRIYEIVAAVVNAGADDNSNRGQNGALSGQSATVATENTPDLSPSDMAV